MVFQRAVLPAKLPHLSGLQFDALYEPGSVDAQVGGDWYDAVRLLDGRVLVTIGDVTGRGLDAAVVVGVVRALGPAAWHNPAAEIKRVVIPDGSADDVAILVLRVDFATFERHVERRHLDARDAAAATALRKEFTASLPGADFSSDNIANAELVLGELIGNVVRHAGGGGETEIVTDHSGSRTVLHVLDAGVGFRYVS
jgi:hypothetical protein